MASQHAGGMESKSSDSLSTIFDYPYSYPITKYGFQIPGLGKAGEYCGVNRVSHFSRDGDAMKYSPLRCKRVECPKCWRGWATKSVFSLALRIEAYAELSGERPYAVIMSVPPSEAKEWSWDRVNTSLFRRGYRRAREHAGVDGGTSLFHPYRIKKRWQYVLKRSGESSNGMWNAIRKRVNAGQSLLKFVNFGPHVHSIVFGNPQAHRCDDYLIRFNDNDHSLPKRLDDVGDVVGLLYYLVSHSGILYHLERYQNGIYRKKTHTIRGFGVLFRFEPQKELAIDDFNRQAERVARAMILRVDDGHEVTMMWDSELAAALIKSGFSYREIVDECLSYPASPKDLDTGKVEPKWIPIRLLGEYLGDDEWLTFLSVPQRGFWLKMWKFVIRKGRPPFEYEVGDGFDPPLDVEVWVRHSPVEDSSSGLFDGGEV